MSPTEKVTSEPTGEGSLQGTVFRQGEQRAPRPLVRGCLQEGQSLPAPATDVPETECLRFWPQGASQTPTHWCI